MAIKIVTGDQGKPHVTANDDGSFHQGVVGTEDYALGVGKKVKATLVSNNSVRIDDGELVMQGVHFRILPGTYENVTINNGNQGQKRKDAIVARYTKDSSSGIENVTLAVLQGTPTTGTPVAPTPTIGDIRSGALKHEMILYVVELNGLNVVGVEPVFEILMSMKEIKDGFGELNSKLNDVRFVFGTKTTNLSNASSMAMFTIENLKARFGVNDGNIKHYHVLLMNGDGANCPAHVEGATWYNTTCMAVFEKAYTGPIRVNYMIAYTPNKIDGE